MKKKLLSIIMIIIMIASMNGCTKEQLSELTEFKKLSDFDILNMDYPEYIGDHPEVRATILGIIYTYNNAIGLAMLQNYDVTIDPEDYDLYTDAGYDKEKYYMEWISSPNITIANLFNRYGLCNEDTVEYCLYRDGWKERLDQKYVYPHTYEYITTVILPMFGYYDKETSKEPDYDKILDFCNLDGYGWNPDTLQDEMEKAEKPLGYAPNVFPEYLKKNPDAELKDKNGNILKLSDLEEYLNEKYSTFDIDNVEFSEPKLSEYLYLVDDFYIPYVYKLNKKLFSKENGEIIKKYTPQSVKDNYYIVYHYGGENFEQWVDYKIRYYSNHLLYLNLIYRKTKPGYSGNRISDIDNLSDKAKWFDSLSTKHDYRAFDLVDLYNDYIDYYSYIDSNIPFELTLDAKVVPENFIVVTQMGRKYVKITTPYDIKQVTDDVMRYYEEGMSDYYNGYDETDWNYTDWD